VSKRPTRIALNGLYPHEFNPVVPLRRDPDFLDVGEFREAKGIDTLVQAISDLAATRLSPTITMVGSGPVRRPDPGPDRRARNREALHLARRDAGCGSISGWADHGRAVALRIPP